ncbi:hypothetical protein TGFOU_290740A, partial [Toxoplasma gondii FOU]
MFWLERSEGRCEFLLLSARSWRSPRFSKVPAARDLLSVQKQFHSSLSSLLQTQAEDAHSLPSFSPRFRKQRQNCTHRSLGIFSCTH